MPRNPNSLQKWNYIKNFWFDPCDAPISVYITTLYPALIEALMTYYAVDLVQIFTGFVAPGSPLKGRRGGSHRGPKQGLSSYEKAKKGQRNGKGGKRTFIRRLRKYSGFDPYDWLGKKGGQFFGLPGREVTPGVQFLWHVYGLEQRVAYFMMFAEITEQFFYKWLSGVAESRYCDAQYRPWCYCTSSSEANFGVLGVTPATIDQVVKARLTLWAAGNGIAVQGKGSACVFKGKFRGPDNVPTNKLRIVHQSGVTIDGPPMIKNGSTYTVSGTALEPGLWYFYTVGPSLYFIDDVEYTVIGAQQVYAPPEA